MLKRLNPNLLIGLGVIVFVIIMVLLYKSPFSRPGISVDLSHSSVIKEIESLNRLETASFTIEKIVEAGQEGNVFQNLLYGDRILLIAHGKVTAGVDLSEIQENDVTVRGEKLTLNVPAPEIFTATLDNEKTTVYDRTQGLLSRGNKDLESSARLAAETSIRSAACDAGVLLEARENAVERLIQLFKFAGFSIVEVNIPEGNC